MCRVATLIGDVSGTPDKNAANEGADAIKHIVRELNNGAGAEPESGDGRGIIGIGQPVSPVAIGGSAVSFRYVGIEQDKVLATIDAIQGKYVSSNRTPWTRAARLKLTDRASARKDSRFRICG